MTGDVPSHNPNMSKNHQKYFKEIKEVSQPVKKCQKYLSAPKALVRLAIIFSDSGRLWATATGAIGSNRRQPAA